MKCGEERGEQRCLSVREVWHREVREEGEGRRSEGGGGRFGGVREEGGGLEE